MPWGEGEGDGPNYLGRALVRTGERTEGRESVIQSGLECERCGVLSESMILETVQACGVAVRLFRLIFKRYIPNKRRKK